jgi:hypothetical protein
MKGAVQIAGAIDQQQGLGIAHVPIVPCAPKPPKLRQLQ